MVDRITAGWESLLEDAKVTAREFLEAAESAVADKLGKDVANKHPELIAQIATNMHYEFRTGTMAAMMQNIEDALGSIAGALDHDD
jgi:hypothetical protein